MTEEKHTRIFVSKNTQNPEVFVLFYEEEGLFSNFHPANFKINVNENPLDIGWNKERIVEFSCSEQYFMYKKAILVHDEASAHKILMALEPMRMKLLGRRLKMSKEDLLNWSEKSRIAMYRACLEKFAQNQRLRLYLFRTHGMKLVEASANDAIWGNGLDKYDPRSENRETWQGTNWLGEILDKVREELWIRTEFRAEREKVLLEPFETRCQLLEGF